jgi:hypothetical protein
VISGNSQEGVRLQDYGSLPDVVQGNFIGTDVTATRAVGNGDVGVWVRGDTPSPDVVGGSASGDGNLISGNAYGIRLFGNGNVVQGNLIGTDVTGTRAVGNSVGVLEQDGGNDNLIGGPDTNTPGQPLAGGGNVISANRVGISMSAGVPMSDNVVAGNYIGTDITGTYSVSYYGITGVELGVNATANTIGGTTVALRNVISGNEIGVLIGPGPISGNLASNNVVEGNYIGPTASGAVMGLPAAAQKSVFIYGGNNNQIGVPGAGNVISGQGVWILGNLSGIGFVDSSGNLVQGNSILSGGVQVSASNNTVGGTAPGAGNVITGSGNGVSVSPSFNNGVNVDTTGVSILGNSIYGNSNLGIAVGGGANHNQAAPQQIMVGSSTSWTLASAANTTYRIEFFATQRLDGSGTVEGQTFLGFATVTTDANGYLASSPDGSAVITNPETPIAIFTATGLAAAPAGQPYLSATATNLSTNDNSQFSAGTVPSVATLTSSANPSVVGQDFGLTAKLNAFASGQGTPTGSVHFFDTSTNTDLGSAPLSGGTATLFPAHFDLNPGTHVIAAIYSGDSTFYGSSTSITLTVNPVTSGNLQSAINAQLQANPSDSTFNIVVANDSQLMNVISAVNGLAGQASPITLALYQGGSGNYSGETVTVPANLSLVLYGFSFNSATSALVVTSGNVTVNNGAFTESGDAPALLIESGNVTINSVTFTELGNAPTILVTGGSLTLRYDTIQESTASSDAALSITGGTVDLGTTASPGNNLINVNGAGRFLDNATSNPEDPFGDLFQVNGGPPPAIPVNITVTNTNDSGPGSLRQAINDATVQGILNTGSPTITFAIPTSDPGYNPTTGTATISLTSGELPIDYSLSISGPGANQVAVNGANASRVFEILSGMTAAISGLTIENGQDSTSGGGGILNSGTLSISDCTLSANSSPSLRGGGIYDQGMLTVNNCTFADNSARLGGGVSNFNGSTIISNSSFTGNSALTGGGIFNAGISGTTLTVSNSTFAGNSAAQGGGIIDGGTLTVSNCTFAGNSAGPSSNPNLGNGGGLFVSSGFAQARVNNSTFAGNTASRFGGGIYFTRVQPQSVLLTNVTIADNTCGTSALGGQGGGIYVNPNSTLNPALNNTIVAGNLNGSGAAATADDIAGSVSSASQFNLIGTGGSGGLQDRSVDPADGNLVGVATPGLGPLGNYGGPTQTMALLAGSPAVGAGSVPLAVDANGTPLTTDQRGAGFPRTINNAVDVGAFESGGLSLESSIQQVLSPSNPVTVQANNSAEADALISAVNQLPSYSSTTVTVTLNLSAGATYSDLTPSPPAGVTLVINGQGGTTTIVGQSPALTVSSGTVIVTGVTLTTATNAPTVLVTGGSLTLRNDIVQESTGFSDPAIQVTGGMLDLGTASSPGGNTLNVNGSGEFVHNTTANLVPAAGDSFAVNGTALAAPTLSFTTLTTSQATTIPGQPVSLTAAVRPDGTGLVAPTGSVDFFDATTNTDLGPALLTGGAAVLNTAALALGTHVIRANYSGDSDYLPSLDALTQTVTQSIYVLNTSAAGSVSVSGNAGIAIPGTLYVDSSSRTALTESGKAQITAAGIQVVGGVSTSGNATLSPAATTGAASVADPLSSLTGPGTSGLTNYGAASYSQGAHTLSPGIYSQISASGSASLTLNPGLYLIEGGGFTVTGQASVSGTGVTIYNTSRNYPSNTGSYGGITLSGNGTFSLTAPASGPYTGIVIFQARANTRAVSLSSKAGTGLGGTVYAPEALVYLSGNATVNGALVVNELSLSGNAASTQVTDGGDISGGSTAGQLLAGDLEVYVNDPNNLFTTDELTRIQDAVNVVDAVVEPYGVSVSETTDPTAANVTIDTGSTSAVGGQADGILGCWNPVGGEITLVQGWNWYAGSDPTQIGAGQYDFQTTLTHELGHALGLGESNDPTSAMSGTLATGTVIRTLTTADLNIPPEEVGADAQRAAPAAGLPAASQPEVQSSTEMPSGKGGGVTTGDADGLLATGDLNPIGQGRTTPHSSDASQFASFIASLPVRGNTLSAYPAVTQFSLANFSGSDRTDSTARPGLVKSSPNANQQPPAVDLAGPLTDRAILGEMNRVWAMPAAAGGEVPWPVDQPLQPETIDMLWAGLEQTEPAPLGKPEEGTESPFELLTALPTEGTLVHPLVAWVGVALLSSLKEVPELRRKWFGEKQRGKEKETFYPSLLE